MCCDRGVPGAWCWFAGVGSPVVGSSGVVWWPVWAWRAVFGRCSCPYVTFFPSGVLFRGVLGFGTSARVVVVLLPVRWLVRHRLRRPMAGLSCRWMRLAVAAVYGRFRLLQLRWADTGRCDGASPPQGGACPQGEKGSDNWYNPLKKVLKFRTTRPVPPWRHLYTHNSSSGISQCPSAVLSAALVPIICTSPSVARPLRSPLVHPRAPHGSPRVLRLLGGAVLLLVFACLSCAVSCRVLRILWLACLCRSAVSGG